MSGLKWIKIDTNIFNDTKIQLIENMPDGDAIIVISRTGYSSLTTKWRVQMKC